MQLAFSTNAFTRYSLEESMTIIRDIGYEGVEIMADQPHLWPPEMDADQLGKIKDQAERLNLTLCNINAFMMKAIGDIHHPSWIEARAEDRKARLAHTRACLEIARELRVPWISTEPGGPLEGLSREQGLAYFREGIEAAEPLAQEMGVKLLIEPEPGLLLESMEETLDFLAPFAQTALGINFDAGHFYCIGADPAALIRRYPDHLTHIHMEDIHENRKHHHLIPGRGAMDYDALFSSLRQVDYQGFVTVELYPYEEEPIAAAKEAFTFLRDYLNR